MNAGEKEDINREKGDKSGIVKKLLESA